MYMCNCVILLFYKEYIQGTFFNSVTCVNVKKK